MSCFLLASFTHNKCGVVLPTCTRTSCKWLHAKKDYYQITPKKLPIETNLNDYFLHNVTLFSLSSQMVLQELKEACKVILNAFFYNSQDSHKFYKTSNWIKCGIFPLQSFEKVLVQNIQFGLSPSLTSALHAIPRWRLVQAALPHVMHCAAALLHNR